MHERDGKIIQKKKYQELVEAIKRRNFPILVHGPSGSGKTFTITKALLSCDMKYRHVELDGKIIRKPIDKNMVTLIYLYNQKDLENIKFKTNLIIETCIPWANKFQDFLPIKFTRQSQKQLSDVGIFHSKNDLFAIQRAGQDTMEIDLFRFLGRIFYKKLSISQIFIENRNILYYCLVNTLKRIPLKCEYELSSEQQSEVCLSRRFILSDSESSLSNEKINFPLQSNLNCTASFEDDFIFQSSDSHYSLEQANDFSIDMAISRLKKIVKADESGVSGSSKSFNLKIFENFVYENFLSFVAVNDLPEVYNCLSLAEFHSNGFICFIQSLLEFSCKQTKSVSTFKYPNIDIHVGKARKNKDWRYCPYLNDKND